MTGASTSPALEKGSIPVIIEKLPPPVLEKGVGMLIDVAANTYVGYVGLMAKASGGLANKLSEIFPNLGTGAEVEQKLLENGRKVVEGGAAGVNATLDTVIGPLIDIMATKEPKTAELLKMIAEKAKEKIEPTKVAVLEKLTPSS